MVKKEIPYTSFSKQQRQKVLLAFAATLSDEKHFGLTIVSFTTVSHYVFYAFEDVGDQLMPLLMGNYTTELFIPFEESQAFMVVIKDQLSMNEIDKRMKCMAVS